MNKYVPLVGDSVAARYKGDPATLFHHKVVVGPVMEVTDTTCTIITNKDRPLETTFILELNGWNFQFLHKTEWKMNAYRNNNHFVIECDAGLFKMAFLGLSHISNTDYNGGIAYYCNNDKERNFLTQCIPPDIDPTFGNCDYIKLIRSVSCETHSFIKLTGTYRKCMNCGYAEYDI